MPEQPNHPLLTAIDLSPYHRVVDVGGGDGTTLVALLETYAHMRGILFDLPDVVEESLINMEGLGGRLVPVGGDFFEQVPSGGDLYLLEYVLSDWEGDWAQGVLQSVHKAMPHGARLLLLDVSLAENGLPETANLQRRTEPEYRELLETTGFAVLSTTLLADGSVLIEAEPA